MIIHALLTSASRLPKITKTSAEYKSLRTVSVIGEVLALTIALETGELAHFAGRYDPVIARFYQKKCAKSLSVVAIKPVLSLPKSWRRASRSLDPDG